MRDRIVQYPNRYKLNPVSGQTDIYDLTPEPGIVTEPGTDISKANLLKGATAALYGLDSGAVPDEVFAAIGTKLPAIDKNFVNILRLKLQQSLKANDIDAWSDMLDDASGINAGASSGYTLSGGKIYPTQTIISQTNYSHTYQFGYSTSEHKLGQTFTATKTGFIENITTQIIKSGTPSDSVTMKIYAENKTTLLYTASNTIPASEITTGVGSFIFNFSDAEVTNGVVYFFTLERTGALDTSNYYMGFIQNTNTYAGGQFFFYVNGTWGAYDYDLYFIINYSGSCLIVWNAVTATEPLINAAITAEESPNSGTITRYLSDDGINWIEITALDTVQAVNFDSTSVYLKYVLTGDANLSAVAWGGY